MTLLGKVMPYQIHAKTEVVETRYESVEEVRRVIVERGLDKLLRDDVIVPMKRKN